VSVVKVMQKTFAAIARQEIIDRFVPLRSEKPAAQAIAMWATLGARTMDVMADGSLCLAQLWDRAWAQGSGDANIKSLGELDEATLEAIYRPAGSCHRPRWTPSVQYSILRPHAQLRPSQSSSQSKNPPGGRKVARNAPRPTRGRH
jgi:hypothetical protein